MKCNNNFYRSFFRLTEQTFPKDKSLLSLKNLEKHFTNVGIGIETCLILALIMVGFETWRLVSYFYEGLTPKDRQMVELMCNGTFKDKDPNEAMEYLDLLFENAQNWDITGTYEAPSKTQPHTSSGEMYNLREDHDLQAKFASLARKVEALELKKSGQLKYV